MALRDLSEVPYLPMLSLRPAEMRALEELPNTTKDQLLPIIGLRPWVGAHRLESAVERIRAAYGARPIVIAMGEPEHGGRPVHGELRDLRLSAQGFRNWCDFIAAEDHYIPAIQFSPELADESAQIECLHELGRGLFVIIERPAFPAIANIAQRVGQRTQDGEDVCFVLDFGLASRDHLQVAAAATNLISIIRNHAPSCWASLSASSFPDSFVNLDQQDIYERRLFDEVAGAGEVADLIYSDRGSARVERQTGGGGQPAPRIDYPLASSWEFWRSDDQVGFAGYRQQARLLMADATWNADLRVWGTQMIERTAAGDTSAVSGAAKATAARINIHLQRQTFHDDPDAAEDTDEDWEG